MTINSYYSDTKFTTYEFRKPLRFLYFINFRIATKNLPKKIAIVEGEDELKDFAIKCGSHFNIDIYESLEQTIQTTHIIQKVDNWDIYKKQLKEINQIVVA